MKKKIGQGALLIAVLFIVVFEGLSQTGPGGVGRTDGTSSLEGWYIGNTGIEEAIGDSAELGDIVIRWLDQSGNNNHIVLDAGFGSGTFLNNLGYNGLFFATGATTKIMVAPSLVSSAMTDLSIFSAYVNSTATNGNERPAGITTNPAWVGGPTNGNNFSQGTDNSIRKDNGNIGGSVPSNISQMTVRSSLMEPGAIRDYADGASNITSGASYTTNTATLFRIGQLRNANNEPWLYETMFFSTKVNSAQRIIIDNYLSAKFGSTLIANDVYDEDNAGNGNFDHEAAGIGRVDAANLHDESQGTGIVRVLNPSDMDDDEFLMWGHDQNLLTLNKVSDLPAGVLSMSQRTWRASEMSTLGATVDVGCVDIRWDLTGLGNYTASEIALLVDTNNDGFFNDEFPLVGATDLGGNVFEFSTTYLLQDNVRFTIALVPPTYVAPPLFTSTIVDSTVCLVDSINITVVFNEIPVSVLWDFGDLNTSNTIGATGHIYAAPGNYLVQGTIIYPCHTELVSYNVTVFALPVVDLGSDTTICETSLLVLDAAYPGSTYLWQDNSFNQTFIVTNTGTYFVELTDPNGCQSEDTINVSIQQQADAGGDSSIVICSNSTPIDMNSMLSTGQVGQWSEISAILSQNFNSPTGILNVNTGLSGIYSFEYVVDGAFCPNDSSTMQVEIIELPTAGNNASLSVCSGDGNVDLNVLLSTNINPGTWQETTSSGQFNAGTGVFNPNLLPDNAYIFEYTIDSVPPCPLDAAIITINVTSTPIVSFSVAPPNGCEELEVLFQDQSIAGASASCAWDFGDLSTSSTCGSQTHLYTNAGIYSVTLTIDNNGCIASETQLDLVEVYPRPIADFSSTSQLFSDDPTASFNNESSADAIQFSWNFGDGTTGTDENPLHSFPIGVAGDYIVGLVVENQYGCTDSTFELITVEDILLFYVPNSFTPDGDEHNNEFIPILNSGIDLEDYHLILFNRWGNVVFESHDAGSGWDGMLNGQLVQNGTYTWKLSFADLKTDERYVHLGHVNILY